jgi:DNA-binding NarL/FixJ family response regulator
MAMTSDDQIPLRVFVADDVSDMRALVRFALEDAPDMVVVGEAGNGAEAVAGIGQTRPDVVLLDLSMPDLDGLATLPGLRAAAPGCEVVVLTASGTEENLLGAIRGGAAGYLLKSEPPERIVSFLRGVAKGEAALSGEVARRLLDQLRSGGRLGGGVPHGISDALSAREVEVLLLLDEHLSTDDIARRLFISEHTVRSHVKSMLRKLSVSSRRDALEQLALARR